jgi:aminopeptidase YwaD
VVRTNPYEGGSDHTVFTRAGVPALLNWHFTDRYYHTNLDTPDKTSAPTMGNVATAVATTALFLASADASDEAPLMAGQGGGTRANRDRTVE